MKREEGSSQLPDLKHLKRFFLSISSRVAIAEKKQRQLDRKKATRFNVFDLYSAGRKQAVGYFEGSARPQRRPRPGESFSSFVFQTAWHSASGHEAHERCHSASGSAHAWNLEILRRMDILIEAGMLKVAIENKGESMDQPEQIKDHLEHLRYCTPVPPARSMLIYLTPDGRRPDSISPEEFDREVAGNKLCCWSYGDQLRAWLEQCRTKCKAPRIRDFISDFVRYIDSDLTRKPRLNESKNTVNTKSIQKFILQSERNFRIAAAVAEAWREARRQLMSSFLDRLETQLTRKLKGWKPSREGNFFKTWARGITSRNLNGERVIGLHSSARADGSEIYIGITWETDNLRKQARIELLTALQTIYPSAKFGSRWVYEMVRSPAPTGASRMCCGECIRIRQSSSPILRITCWQSRE